MTETYDHFNSCFGNHNDLDARVNQGRQTEEFTEALVNMLDERTLWQDYGIVKGVKVSLAFAVVMIEL